MSDSSFLGFIHLDEFKKFPHPNTRSNREAVTFPICDIARLRTGFVVLRDGTVVTLYTGECVKIQQAIDDVATTYNCTKLPEF